MTFPSLLKNIADLRNKYSPHEICIEAASSGHAAIQTLRQYISSVIDLKPNGSKFERLSAATPSLEAGSVLFPMSAPWLAEFRNEIISFPHTKHDEAVDCLSYAVNRYLMDGPTYHEILSGWAKAASMM